MWYACVTHLCLSKTWMELRANYFKMERLCTGDIFSPYSIKEGQSCTTDSDCEQTAYGGYASICVTPVPACSGCSNRCTASSMLACAWCAAQYVKCSALAQITATKACTLATTSSTCGLGKCYLTGAAAISPIPCAATSGCTCIPAGNANCLMCKRLVRQLISKSVLIRSNIGANNGHKPKPGGQTEWELSENIPKTRNKQTFSEVKINFMSTNNWNIRKKFDRRGAKSCVMWLNNHICSQQYRMHKSNQFATDIIFAGCNRGRLCALGASRSADTCGGDTQACRGRCYASTATATICTQYTGS